MGAWGWVGLREGRRCPVQTPVQHSSCKGCAPQHVSSEPINPFRVGSSSAQKDFETSVSSSASMGKRAASGGGSRQVAARARLQESRGSGSDARGHLAYELLQMRAWGHIPSTVVRSLAAAAVADGVQCPQLKALSELGASGNYSGNVDRDLDLHLQSGLKFDICIYMQSHLCCSDLRGFC